MKTYLLDILDKRPSRVVLQLRCWLALARPSLIKQDDSVYFRVEEYRTVRRMH